MKNFSLSRSIFPLFAATALLSSSAQAVIVFTYEAAGVQSSSVPGVLTEDFNDGSYAGSLVGTFAGGSINGADQYGGAGGAGSYLFSSGGSATTLTFPVGQNYVGFWWSAGDPANVVSFYDDTATLLATFTTSNAFDTLTPAYFGNPNLNFLGQNANEAYAYLNFTNVGGPTIRQIVFGGSNFEVDNISTTTQVIAPPSQVPDGGSTLMLLSMVLLGGLGLSRFEAKRSAL